MNTHALVNVNILKFLLICTSALQRMICASRNLLLLTFFHHVFGNATSPSVCALLYLALVAHVDVSEWLNFRHNRLIILF